MNEDAISTTLSLRWPNEWMVEWSWQRNNDLCTWVTHMSCSGGWRVPLDRSKFVATWLSQMSSESEMCWMYLFVNNRSLPASAKSVGKSCVLSVRQGESIDDVGGVCWEAVEEKWSECGMNWYSTENRFLKEATIYIRVTWSEKEGICALTCTLTCWYQSVLFNH